MVQFWHLVKLQKNFKNTQNKRKIKIELFTGTYVELHYASYIRNRFY